MTELTWQDPPPQRRGRTKGTHGTRWTSILEQCQARPGQWACVGTQKSNNSQYALKNLGLEATTRKNADGSHDLYVRWPES